MVGIGLSVLTGAMFGIYFIAPRGAIILILPGDCGSLTPNESFIREPTLEVCGQTLQHKSIVSHDTQHFTFFDYRRSRYAEVLE